ncbi:MAG: hypothetical protein Q4C95_11845 [Planctomycetia bacterium]|nr:hypothetical protein [Planctomycetia bacterium]MDO5114213.1 hypothetical protein [Planctomycetia bacterium]
MGTGRSGLYSGTQGSRDSSCRLPNASRSVISPKKVHGYALNPEHPVGKNKAKVFQSALGYNQSNADELIAQIQTKVSECVAIQGKSDQYGQRYSVDIPITGPNGKTAIVRTGWIVRVEGDQPELTTVYVKD